MKKTIIKNMCVVLSVTLLSVSAIAEIPANQATQTETKLVRTLTLIEAIQLAEANNAQLQSLFIAQESAVRQYRNTWNQFMPAFSLSGTWSNSHSFSGETSAAGSWNVAGGINLDLTATVPAEIAQKQIVLEAAEIDYRQAKTELHNSVIQSFYELISKRENIKLQKESLAQAETQYQQIQTKYRSGLSSELDLMNAKYAVESQKPEITRLESILQHEMNTFCVTIGINYTEHVELNGEITVTELCIPDIYECIAKYCGNRFDVLAAINKLKSAQNQVKLAKTGTLAPSLRLSEQVTCKENNSDIAVGGVFTATISVPLNGFISGTTENIAIKEKEDLVQSASLQLANTRRTAEIDITNKAAEIARILGSINAAQLNVEIAVRTWDLAQEGFKNGLIDQKDFEDYRLKKVSAQQSLLQTQISYITAVNNLSDALGILPEELYTTFAIKEQD